MALTTFIGQNLGAQEYERAKKGARFGLIACVSIAEAIGLAIYAFIPALIAMFIQSGDAAQVQEVIRLGTMHARIISCWRSPTQWRRFCAAQDARLCR